MDSRREFPARKLIDDCVWDLGPAQGKGLLSGFSLVEMLVVIAIVAILGALVLVSIPRGQKKAKAALCLNNLRQIAVGFGLYTQQNNSRFPVRVSEKGSTGKPPNPKGNRDDWRFFDVAIGGVEPAVASPQIPRAKERPLFPFLGASAAFGCPFDVGWDFRPDGDAVGPSAFVAHGCSYLYNTSPSGRGEPLGLEGIAGKSESWVPNPSKYILMYEPPASEHQRGALVITHNWKDAG